MAGERDSENRAGETLRLVPPPWIQVVMVLTCRCGDTTLIDESGKLEKFYTRHESCGDAMTDAFSVDIEVEPE